MLEVVAPGVTDTHSSEEFGKLFEQHSKVVYRTACGVTGNAEDAEDVLQTVFTHFWVQLQRNPRVKDNPRAYLHRAALNASLNTVKCRRPTEAIEPETFLATVPATSDGGLHNDARERLLTALDTIAESNEPGVELLVLRYFHNLSDAAIARMLGKSRGAIALRMYRAKARLKKILKELLRD